MITTRQILQRSALMAIGLLAITGSPALAQNYVFSDMGGISNPSRQYGPRDINNLGQVVADSPNGTPAVWNNGTWTDLPTLPGYTSFTVAGINDAGHLVGSALPAADSTEHASVAFRWANSTTAPTVLTGLVPLDLTQGPFPTDSAWAINNLGAVAGSVLTTGGVEHGALWQPGSTTVTDLGDLGGGGTFIINNSINDAGTVAGTGQTANGESRQAAAWVNGGAPELLALLPGGLNSEASAINNLGQIVGGALNGDFDDIGDISVPVLWNSVTAQPTLLGTLGGARGVAISINDQGQIVGFSETADGVAHATLWDNGQIIDLTQFIPAELLAAGWRNSEDPVGQSSIFSSDWININNHGVIVTSLYNGDTGTPWMLTPVPVPAAVWLFGSGLVGLAGLARRRMQSTH